MAKVLVLYYSTYGHIETMAGAIAEGARSAGATVDIKRGPETAPEAGAQAAPFKLAPARADRHGGGLGQLRRHPRRHRHPLRPHVFADGCVPRPGRRALGKGRAE